MDVQEWISINFKLPKEPSRVRVSVWRKLKRSGSVSIGQSMWILPFNDLHCSIFEDIANEVKENNGEVFIIKTDFMHNEDKETVINHFNTARDEEYLEFLEKCDDYFKEIESDTANKKFSFIEIEENEHELEKLKTWLKKIVKRDFFKSSLYEKSMQSLEMCKAVFEEFTNKTYDIKALGEQNNS